MRKKIKEIHVGLPDFLKDIVFLVADDYRTNVLSLIPGGLIIVIEYFHSEVLGYDKVKYPSSYIKRIIEEYLCKKNKPITEIEDKRKLALLKQEISRIFVGKDISYKQNTEKTIFEFKEIWNSESTDLPWDILKIFDPKIQKSFFTYLEFIHPNYRRKFFEDKSLLTLLSGMYKLTTSEYDLFSNSNPYIVKEIEFNFEKTVFKVPLHPGFKDFDPEIDDIVIARYKKIEAKNIDDKGILIAQWC